MKNKKIFCCLMFLIFLMPCISTNDFVVQSSNLDNSTINNNQICEDSYNPVEKKQKFSSQNINSIEQENREYYTGHIPLPENYPTDSLPEYTILSLPSSWDWRDQDGQDYTTPVKSQGGCGSCWAFAALGALESRIEIEEQAPDFDIDLSEQYLISCPQNSGGCSGWHATNAYEFLLETGGIIPESCFPYRADDMIPCSDKCENWEEYLILILGYKTYRTSMNNIKNILVEDGPVYSSMVTFDDFNNYNNGIYEHPGSENDMNSNHAVVIVGYNDDPGYWICKNSWGNWWGENGFFKIAYGDCKIAEYVVVVEFDANLANFPPHADADGPYSGKIGENIIFNADASYDIDENIEFYQWDFGDGTISNEKKPCAQL